MATMMEVRGGRWEVGGRQFYSLRELVLSKERQDILTNLKLVEVRKRVGSGKINEAGRT
jgi:hypothetical protein